MADHNTVIEGTLKFRDGKKWKSRWCVMRRLSPVADCLHLQLYRDSRARCARGPAKASLALQHFLGFESGFTLDKESNTVALLCRDVSVVLAFDSRERLIQWQVKLAGQLGEPSHFLVLLAGEGGGARLPPGPARLHLLGRRFALAAGTPPRLLGLWELAHLRRYGVVEGRFCFEGGSLCGAGEGLHVLLSDRPHDIAAAFDLAAGDRLSLYRQTTLSKLNGEGSSTSQEVSQVDLPQTDVKSTDYYPPLKDIRLCDEAYSDMEIASVVPHWSTLDFERSRDGNMDLGDTLSVTETDDLTGGGTRGITLERCMSCMSKLGALSRSSTMALTPNASHFNPAWTMEAVQEVPSSASDHDAASEHDTLRNNHDRVSPSQVAVTPNQTLRPDLKNRSQTNCGCDTLEWTKVGPYEAYDVPKVPYTKVDSEYYDTPKRLRGCLDEELFKIPNKSASKALVPKKSCSCILKLGAKKYEPTIVDSGESFRPATCACERMTRWAHSWVGLPYCRRPGEDASLPGPDDSTERRALYATIDVARKTRNKIASKDKCVFECNIDEGPLANYENLNFALSLEHYENAKSVQRKAGVMQSELDAIGARLNSKSLTITSNELTCIVCEQSEIKGSVNIAKLERRPSTADDYLMMEPGAGNVSAPVAGYTRMSPFGNLAHRALENAFERLLDDRSVKSSGLPLPETRDPNIATKSVALRRQTVTSHRMVNRKVKIHGPKCRKRSNSADSLRYLEDHNGLYSSVHDEKFSSSLEILRDPRVLATVTLGECRPLRIDHDGRLPQDISPLIRDLTQRALPSKRSRSVPGRGAANRDSCSSNDSGVSSCSLRPSELELSTARTRARRHHHRSHRSHSTDPPTEGLRRIPQRTGGIICSSPTGPELEMPSGTPLGEARASRGVGAGVVDTRSTSSGTSDMSDYVETLSLCSSQSSGEAPSASVASVAPATLRSRHATSTLRPRSGGEYQSLQPCLAALFRGAPQREREDLSPAPRVNCLSSFRVS